MLIGISGSQHFGRTVIPSSFVPTSAPAPRPNPSGPNEPVALLLRPSRERLSRGISTFEWMEELDLGLAALPAQEHEGPIDLAVEVHKPGRVVFQERTEGMNPLGVFFEERLEVVAFAEEPHVIPPVRAVIPPKLIAPVRREVLDEV